MFNFIAKVLPKKKEPALDIASIEALSALDPKLPSPYQQPVSLPPKEKPCLLSQYDYILESRLNSQIDENPIPLCVPFKAKDIVKQLNAKWCPKSKAWFLSLDQDISKVLPWVPKIYQGKGPHILPNMVPSPIWGVNLRSLLPRGTWDQIRKSIYLGSGHRCEVCGSKGDEWPVECEEQWEYVHYSKYKGAARLVNLQSLCPMCHKIKHLGKANIDGILPKVIHHFAHINEITLSEASTIVDEAFILWEKRSLMEWDIDLTEIEARYGLNIDTSKKTTSDINREFRESI